MISLRPAILGISLVHAAAALFVTVVSGCEEPPDRLPPVTAGDAGPDGSAGCARPSEGCPCVDGTEPIECFAEPLTVDGQLYCQHGTRSCRDSVWSACEDISQYLPPPNKIIGAPSPVSACLPDNFIQTTIPDLADLTPTQSSNLAYSGAGVVGITLDSPQNAANNYGLGVDTDMDGAPDSVDLCPTTVGWALPCDGDPTNDGFFHVLPPGDVTADPFGVVVPPPLADVYVLTDDGLTMVEEHGELRAAFFGTSGIPSCPPGIAGTIACMLPGGGFGLGMAGDFASQVDGNEDNFPFIPLLDPTTDLTVANRTLDVLRVRPSAFHPQATGQALYALGSGMGLGGAVPNRACGNGGAGWGCFTAGRVPVVIVAADAPFWSGASGVGTFAGFAGAAGTATSPGQPLGSGTVTSITGETITSPDTLGTAFALGDLSAIEVTAIGSNVGMASDLATVCGGVTQDGPDAYYEFTTSADAPLVIEASGDFDASIALLDGAGTEVGCDLDSGALTDASGGVVFDRGARLDVRTLTGAGIVTENSTFTGCSVGSQTTNAALTGCTVTPTTSTVDLAGCSVDSVPATSTFAGCTVSSTNRTSVLGGCVVDSTTTTLGVTGCGFGTQFSTANFSGCVADGAPTNLAISGCTENATTAVSGCTATSATATTAFSGCTAVPTSVPLSGCTPSASGAISTSVPIAGCVGSAGTVNNVTFSGCTYPNTVNTLTSCSAGNVPLTNCTVGPMGSRNVFSCINQPAGLPLAVGNTPTATFLGFTAVRTISSVTFTANGGNPALGTYTITMSANGTANATGGITFAGSLSTMYGCQGSLSATLTNVLANANLTVGTTASAFTGAGTAASPYRITLSTAASMNFTGQSVTSTFPDRTSLVCTVTSGTPSVGMTLAGSSPSATVTAMTNVGSTYTFTGLTAQTNAVPAVTGGTYLTYSTYTGCTAGTAPEPGMTIGTTNFPAGTTVSSVSGTGPYTITFSQQSRTSPLSDTLGGTLYNTYTNCASAGDAPQLGLSASGTGLSALSTVTAVSGTGPYTLTLSAHSTSTLPTLSTLDGVGGVTGCTATGFEPAPGMTLTGTNLTAGTTAASAVDAGTWSFGFDRLSPSSATVTGGSYTGLVQLSGCMVTGGAFSGMVFGASTGVAAGTTVTAAVGSGDGPYTLSLDRRVAAGASPAVVSRPGFYRTLDNCTVAGGAPIVGMTLIGAGLSAGVTPLAVTGAGPYSFDLSAWQASGSTLTGATYIPTYTRFTNCTLTSGVPVVGMDAVGTSIPGGTTVTAISTNLGLYTLDLSANIVSSSTLSSVSGFIPDYQALVGCDVSGGAPIVGMDISGPAIPAGTTVTAMTGTGPFDFTLSAAATSPDPTIGSAQYVTYDRTQLVCATAAGDAPVVGMTLSGTGLVAGTTVTGITGTGPYTFDLSTPATTDTATATSGAYITYDTTTLVNCALTSGLPPIVGMPLSGVGLDSATTIAAIAGTGPYTFTLDIPALTNTSSATSGTQPVATNTLSGCEIAAGGPLLAGMAISGTLLPGGATVTSFTGDGSAATPYAVTLSATPATFGATSAFGTIDLPTAQLTGCAMTGGPLIVGMSLTGTLLPGGTTLTGFSGTGPYTLDLSQTATALGTTGAAATITLPTDVLTGCMVSSGNVRVGADLSGSGIAAGTTLVSYVGNGVGPYTIQMSAIGTSIGTTSLASTFTGPPLLYPFGLPAGTYRVVVDSASAAEVGSFQVRFTNPLAGVGVATAATEVAWGDTVNALTGIGARTVGIASCEGGCPNLGALQSAYTTCISGMDDPSSNGLCGTAYQECMASSFAGGALCGTIYDACLDSQTRAVHHGAPAARACADAETECLEGFPVCPLVRVANCTTNANGEPVACYRNDPSCPTANTDPVTACGSLRAACEAATPACGADAVAIVACSMSTSASGVAANDYCDEAVTDLTQLGLDTASTRGDGSPFLYRVDADGSGLGSVVVGGIHDVARTLPTDVLASCVPGTANSCSFFSGTTFPPAVTPVRALEPRCAACSGSGCTGCTSGSNLPFLLGFTNDGTIASTSVPQIFDFDVQATTPIGTVLGTVPVRVVVPPQRTYPIPGSFIQLFDGTLDTATNAGCPYPGSRAFWGTFTYTVDVPAGTGVRFAFRSGESIPELESRTDTSVLVSATTAGGTLDVGALLLAHTGLATATYVRMTATLIPDPTTAFTPTLVSYSQQFACVDSE